MGMKPKSKDKRKQSVKLLREYLGKSVCHKCGEAAETGRDTCSFYPRCKQISERRIIRKVANPSDLSLTRKAEQASQ